MSASQTGERPFPPGAPFSFYFYILGVCVKEKVVGNKHFQQYEKIVWKFAGWSWSVALLVTRIVSGVFGDK